MKYTVQQLIQELARYNPQAQVSVVASNRSLEFEVTWAGPEGISKTDCTNVELCIGPSDNEKETPFDFTPVEDDGDKQAPESEGESFFGAKDPYSTPPTGEDVEGEGGEK